MKVNFFDLVYVITNIFGTYTIFKLMNIFFGDRKNNKLMEILSYITYFIFVSFIYINVKIPIVMTIINLVAFFLLTYNYTGNVKQKITITFQSYLILFCIEMIIIVLIGYIDFPIWEQIKFDSIFAIVTIKIISYLVVLVISKHKPVKEVISIPFLYWVEVVLVPFASILILLILFSSTILNKTSVILAIILTLLINFSVFYLYDKIILIMYENAKSQIFEQQNLYYKKQLELLQSSTKQTQKIKHDMKNHLLTFKALHKAKGVSSCKEYYDDLMYKLTLDDNFISSGNIIIDSIVNFKLKEIQELDAQIFLDINIPDNLELHPFIITTVIGNLLDNAIEGLKILEKNRYFSIKMNYSKGIFIIVISNSFNGNLKMEQGKILSTKKERKNHGIGIENVKCVLEECNGELEIEHSESRFSATALIYVE